MLRNTVHDRGSVGKALHWTTVLIVAYEVPVGFLMAATYGAAKVNAVHVLLAQVHQTAGFAILLLVALRLSWRLSNPVPQLPATMSPFGRRAARATHWAFYALLMLLPLSGWAALSVLGDTERFGDTPIWLFGWDVVPPIVPQRPLDDPFGYAFMASIHRYAVYVGGGLLVLHVAAALWHQLVRRDTVLRRMWPGTGPVSSHSPNHRQ